MTNRSDPNDPMSEPTEYGGFPGDTDVDPRGFPVPRSVARQARDMRAEDLSEAAGERSAQPAYGDGVGVGVP